MKIKALQAFTMRDAETGDLTSVACGAVEEVTDALGNQLITDGLAEAYTLITPTGTKSITENAEGIDVAQYASADVNVPNSYSASDEGKVVSSGALVSQTSVTKSANGTYDTTLNNEVVVAVPQPSGSISITENGTGIDVAQYATADVDVPNPSTGTLNITENGTYDVSEKASAVVNVPDSSADTVKNLIEKSTSVHSFVVPEGVTTIGESAFSKMTGLYDLYLPASVESIGETAFRYCGYGGAEPFVLTINRATPPTLTAVNAFQVVPASYKVRVPSESVETYKSAPTWSSIAEHIEAIPTA